MGKITKFPVKSSIVTFCEEMLEAARAGMLSKIAIVSNVLDFDGKETGEIQTGYFNLDVCERQNFISHLQLDVFVDVVKANIGIKIGVVLK